MQVIWDETGPRVFGVSSTGDDGGLGSANDAVAMDLMLSCADGSIGLVPKLDRELEESVRGMNGRFGGARPSG